MLDAGDVRRERHPSGVGTGTENAHDEPARHAMHRGDLGAFDPQRRAGAWPAARKHRTGGEAAHRGVGLTKQVNDSAGRRAVRGAKAKPIPRFVNQTVAEAFRK